MKLEILKRHFPVLIFLLAIIRGMNAAEAANGQPDAAAKAWATLPDILARIVPPEFPDRQYIITNYGAMGNGTFDCTEAFRKAIDECTQAGGGKVIVPEGTFLTGAIHLRNNVNLCVEKSAVIRFSTNPASYLPVVFTRYEGTEVMNYSPFVYAYGQTNIAITGEGTLDGQASDTVWHNWTHYDEPRRLVEMGNRGVPVIQRIFGAGHHLRPNFVEPVRCKNVLIAGVTILNSPMWVLSPVYCTNVTVRNVTVNTTGANTDGCDPDSCTDVLIKDCTFSDGDDCIAIKSGRDRDGQRIAIPCQNLVVEGCNFEAGHGGIGIGSETSGGIRNVFGENCHFDSPDLRMAIRLKTNPARGGYIENVFVRDCSVKTAQVGIHMTLRYDSSGAMEGESVPIIRDIDIDNCTFANLTKQAIFLQGWSPAHEITDVRISNCRFLQSAEKSSLTNATRIYLPGTEGSGLEHESF